jgi:hypothetical protein
VGNQGSKASFAGLEGLLGSFVVGDIVEGAGDAKNGTVGSSGQLRVNFKPAQASILGYESKLAPGIVEVPSQKSLKYLFTPLALIGV